jgi:hypothetical protein
MSLLREAASDRARASVNTSGQKSSAGADNAHAEGEITAKSNQSSTSTARVRFGNRDSSYPVLSRPRSSPGCTSASEQQEHQTERPTYVRSRRHAVLLKSRFRDRPIGRSSPDLGRTSASDFNAAIDFSNQRCHRLRERTTTLSRPFRQCDGHGMSVAAAQPSLGRIIDTVVCLG